ncbi:EAL domain-containing protein [Sphaerospermopsis aphanizomenoides BCCUSP55]|uniref:two-component system response regulator n=1 Tax=Sphaerospermopsis aphanizomenoides TaxID=459663 RepID=UPI001909036D|nr:GGDEF domain-containing response regulator [Sphaerospermopsis aphanizomenoides]MBK1989550.1 EAL domain-containing protein [Sphaerospermopsis aphanizomenoides BCCUSP55]
MNTKSKFNSEQKDILIVDDTPDNLRFLATILSEQGYYVRKALDGQMAITACLNLLPDLVLLDIMMPEMDGYTVCKLLKSNEKTSKIPVIFLSSIDDVLDKVKAFQVGGVDYITKPFQAEEVFIRIKNQLLLKAAEEKILDLNRELEAKVQERTLQLELANQELKRELCERQQLQNELLYKALHDPLTDLSNRTFLMERLEEAIKLVKTQSDYQFAILFLDCDRFKVINDSLGHLVGDDLLIAIGNRLQTLMRDTDILARLGGDEFAIFLDDIIDINYVKLVADQILQTFSVPFKLSRTEVFITASIGIVFSKSSYNTPQELLRDADTAMYHAKSQGKSRYCIFTVDMYQQAIKLLQLENDLKRAIERQEFIVYYQPIISLSTGKISGFEALVRWQHPTLGMVSPGEFIPVAEETGLIAAIDTWVLQTACRQLRNWQEQKVIDDNIFISVNLSVRLFSQPNLLAIIDQAWREIKLKPQNLKLEITESAIMENSQAAAVILQQLRECKIELSIDDFGTGYSSLSYLHRFPANTLKIDQCFINDLDQNPKNIGLISTIIKLAHTSEMKAVAEGIETPEKLAQLRSLGCDFGQGYLFSKPLPATSVLDLLASEPQW